MAPKKVSKRQVQRIKDRDEIWPDAAAVTWKSTDPGWVPLVPRIISLVAVLANALAPMGAGNPGLAYIDLWLRTDGDGFVKIGRTDDFAMAAGFTGERGERSWMERMRVLEDLGLIRIKDEGNQPIAFVLLLNPSVAVDALIAQRPGDIPPQWLTYYKGRRRDIETPPA